MTPHSILERCRSAGVTLEPTPRGTIRVSAVSHPPPELLHEIRYYREEILAALTMQPTTSQADTSATPSNTQWCAVCGTPRSYVHGDGRSTCPPDYCQYCWNHGNGKSVSSWTTEPRRVTATHNGKAQV